MNVLSLFDGISCGQMALERAGMHVNNYFASEIDSHAIMATKTNFPKTIHLGDVSSISVKDLPQIDLLIGGSPCQGFSFAGKQMNFNDPRSKLFFEYVRLLNELKPRYWLLENVIMKKEFEQVITSHLGKTPAKINSSVLSKQNRNRLYWTNIPFEMPTQVNNYFNGYLYRLGHGFVRDEIKLFKHYPSLTAQSPATKYRIITNLDAALDALNKNDLTKLRRGDTITRSATPEECEDFQTLPIGYTSCLNKTQRYKSIGNGWTVDVVAHILKGIVQHPSRSS